MFICEEVESVYYLCGICCMGFIFDNKSVVDFECWVIGVDCLCVVDLFVFFYIMNGNINVLILMLVEKVSDYICGKVLFIFEFWEYWVYL